MPPLKLACRIDTCDASECFDSAVQVNGSGWSDINPLGAHTTLAGGQIAFEHPAFCPGHSFGDV